LVSYASQDFCTENVSEIATVQVQTHNPNTGSSCHMYCQYTSKVSRAISAGGEFCNWPWNVWYYCQIKTQGKTKQSSNVQHQDWTL